MDSRLTVYSLCLCVCGFGAYGGVVVHVYLCLCIQGKLVPWYSGKESACQCRRCAICRIQSLGWEDPLKENGNPLQHSCLDRGVWRATVHEVKKG